MSNRLHLSQIILTGLCTFLPAIAHAEIETIACGSSKQYAVTYTTTSTGEESCFWSSCDKSDVGKAEATAKSAAEGASKKSTHSSDKGEKTSGEIPAQYPTMAGGESIVPSVTYSVTGAPAVKCAAKDGSVCTMSWSLVLDTDKTSCETTSTTLSKSKATATVTCTTPGTLTITCASNNLMSCVGADPRNLACSMNHDDEAGSLANVIVEEEPLSSVDDDNYSNVEVNIHSAPAADVEVNVQAQDEDQVQSKAPYRYDQDLERAEPMHEQQSPQAVVNGILDAIGYDHAGTTMGNQGGYHSGMRR